MQDLIGSPRKVVEQHFYNYVLNASLSFLEDVLLPFIQGPHTRYILNIHLVLFCCSSEVLSSISRYLYLGTSTALMYF